MDFEQQLYAIDRALLTARQFYAIGTKDSYEVVAAELRRARALLDKMVPSDITSEHD